LLTPNRSALSRLGAALLSASLLLSALVVISPSPASASDTEFRPSASTFASSGNHCWRGYAFQPSRNLTVTHLLGGGTAGGFAGGIYTAQFPTGAEPGNLGTLLRGVTFSGTSAYQKVAFSSSAELQKDTWYFILNGRVSTSSSSTFHHEVTGVSASSIESLEYMAKWRPSNNSGFNTGTCNGSATDQNLATPSAGSATVAVGFAFISAPQVTSFSSTSALLTNSTSIQYSLTTNVSITGLESTDFENAAGATATGCSFSPNPASGSSFVITVTNCSDGTLRPRLKANSVSSSAGPGPSANADATTIITIDRTAPTITSLQPITTSPTKEATLVFRLESNEALSPAPATGNFSVSGTGCSVNSVSVHTTNQWNVNVTGCADNQNVALTLNSNAVKDAAGNTAPPSAITTSSILTDYTAPTISVVRPATPTNALSHTYTFTPSETLNRELELADFLFAQTKGTGCAIDTSSFALTTGTYSLSVDCAEASAHESVFNVTVLAGSTAGGTKSALADLAGNLNVAVTSAQTAVTIDRFTTLTSITVSPNPATGFTNATNVDYTINFSEPVSGLTLDQISVGGLGCVLSIESPTDAGNLTPTYKQAVVRAANCDDGSTLNFTIAPSATGVRDALGNTALNGVTTASAITIDRTAPEVASTSANPSAANNYHNSSTLTYDISFNEVITGLNASMFAATTCSGATSVSGSGTNYTVTFTNCADGPVSPRADLTGDIRDRADNPLSVQTLNLTTVIVDTIAPTSSWEAPVTTLTRASSVAFAITFSEQILASSFTGADLTNAGTATGCNFSVAEDTETPGITAGTRFIVTMTSCSDLGSSATLQPRITNGSITDLAQNPLNQTEALRTADAVTLDRTLPVATFTSGPPLRTNQDLDYTLGFSEPIVGLTNADFSFTGSADECLISITPDENNPTTVFAIALTGCTDGTVRLILEANAVADNAGNLGPNFDLEATVVTVDTVAPVATVSATGGVTVSRDSFVTFDIDFDEPVYNLVADADSFEVGGDGCQLGTLTPANLTAFGQAVASYSLTVTGCADATDATLSVKAGAATDVAGNLGPAVASVAASIEIDRVAAEVVSFTAGEPDELGRATFTVTFNEPVAQGSVSAADFELAPASVPLVTPFAVQRVSATVYEVTAQALTAGDASIQLKSLSITDAIGNPSPLTTQVSEAATLALPALSGGFSLQPSVNAAGYSNATTLRYELAISRAVDTADPTKTLVAADLDLGAITCATTTVTPLAAFLFAIELTGCDNGSLTLAILPDAITDPDGDSWPPTQLNAATVLYDTVAPTATISAPTNTQFLVRHEFTVTFSEPVIGFSATDIALAAGSTASGCQFGFRTVTASEYLVIASACSNGTIAITLTQNSVVDRAGNQGPVSPVTSASITQSPAPAAPTAARVTPDDPTDPNSPNYDPNAQPPTPPTVLARAPERFIGPITPQTQTQLAGAGFVRVSDPEQFAVNTVAASFASLPDWNTPAHLTKTLTVEAGEVVELEVDINPDGQGYMKAQGFLQTENGWLDLGIHEFDEDSSVLSVPAMFALPGSYFIRVALIETGTPPPPPTQMMSFGGFTPLALAAASFTTQAALTDDYVMNLGTQALEISINVTGTAIDLVAPPTTQPTFNGPMFDNVPVTVTTLGGSVTLTGRNLSVSAASVAGQSIRIDRNTTTELTLAIPGLEPGNYDLVFTWSGGRLTVQGSLNVIAVSEALEGLDASNFVTRHIGNNQVKVYAKDIVGVGKIQFFVGGREIAWVTALDETDPKLRFANGTNYLVRTVNLEPGKNRIEIRVNGLRAKFATYIGD
jgi:hypothetical protein